jgi:hypothetical protein
MYAAEARYISLTLMKILELGVYHAVMYLGFGKSPCDSLSDHPEDFATR